MALTMGSLGNCSPEPQWQAAGGGPDLEESSAYRQDRSTVSEGQGGSPAWSRPGASDEVGTGLWLLWKGRSRLVVILHPVQTEEEDGPWPCPWAGTV